MLKNGIVWKDTQGNPIHVHGGYMIYFESGYVVYPLKETEDGLEMIYQDTAEFE